MTSAVLTSSQSNDSETRVGQIIPIANRDDEPARCCVVCTDWLGPQARSQLMLYVARRLREAEANDICVQNVGCGRLRVTSPHAIDLKWLTTYMGAMYTSFTQVQTTFNVQKPQTTVLGSHARESIPECVDLARVTREEVLEQRPRRTLPAVPVVK